MTSARILRLWGIILSTITIFSLSLPAYAKYGGGSGTADDPYQIATAADLILLGDSPADYDKHFILTDDIDLAPNLPGRKTFKKAVIAQLGSFFTGVFDGNGHTIAHLTINSKNVSFLGLFGLLSSGAEVKNVGVLDASVAVSGLGANVGSLVGLNDHGKVLACYSTGAVRGGEFVGGLVGGNAGTLDFCYSNATVNGSIGKVGGLVGGIFEGTITQCYSTGRITGSSEVGGLAGYNDGTVTLCFWDTQTSGQTTSAGGTGKTTTEMHRAATFAGWDFQTTWKIQESMGYPKLKWEPNPNPVVTTLEKVSGDNQRAMFGSQLPSPLTVCVKEQYGQGMAGVQVAFTIVVGDGTLEPTGTVTDASGMASVIVTLGPTVGPAQVRAAVGSLSVDFSMEATTLPVATALEKISGDNQHAIVGSKLPVPLTVCVKDQYGQVMAGVQVAFIFVAGDGTIVPASAVTNTGGVASAELTLGPTTGMTQVRASIGNLSVDFSIEATPAPVPTNMEKVSGDNQQAMVSSRLSSPLTVRVKDQYGHTMAGVQVAFTFVAGDGTVEPALAVTNASGIASTTVTLGPTAGSAKVGATVGSLSVEFSLEATAAPTPTTLEKVSGDNQQAMVNSRLSSPLTVRVKDQYGHAMAGVQVAFTFVAGSGTLEPAMAVTNASGYASTTVTLGPTAGSTKVKATVGSLSVEFSMEAMAAPTPTTLEKVSGDNQQAMVGSELAAPLVVRVRDQKRQSMAGVQVAFTFVAGSGTLEPAMAVTNASGYASTTVTLGPTAGSSKVGATVGSLSVEFSMEATAAPTPTTLEKVSGDNQRAVVGSKLAAPLVVHVNDQYRQSLAGVQVAFTVTDGDGVIEPALVTTDANGLAAAELTLGMMAGLTQVRASVGNLSVDFSIEATSFAPATFSQILYEPIAEIVVPTGDNLVTRAVEEKDGYVYLLTRDGILYTYDVANLPLQQSFVSYRTPVSTRTVSNGTGLLRYGDSVFVYGDRGMTVLDVQNPRTPAVVATSASNHRVYNLVRHDHYLVAVGRVNGDVFYMDGKAMVYSVSDPANPVLVSELSLGIAEQGWSAAVYGSTLYVGHFSASTARSVLRVVDFGDPSHLSILRTLDLTGGSAYPYHLRIVGSQLVECGLNHISLWDLTTPTSPVLLTTQPAEPRVCAQDGDYIVTNGMVFCPNGNELQTVAAFTPGGSQVDGFPYGSAVNTSFVFIAQSNRVLVLNASVPVLTINHTTGGPGSSFTVTGHDFAPSSMATVVVNDHSAGTISADSSGGIRFLLSTEQADEGPYLITATANYSASTRFVIASGEPVHPQEGSGTIFAVPSGIAYVKYCGGTGEPNDPYRIGTAADLIVLGETPEDYDKRFILTADIDLHPSLPGGRVFDQAVIAPHPETGAGNWPFNENPFKGVFDGNGHRISHLTIDGAGYLGLFGQLAAEAEIRNLEVVDVNIVGSGGYIGGLLGLTWNGTVTNCHSDGIVSGNYYIGGLVGYNVGTVSCCSSACTIDGMRWSIGGLVGYNGADTQQSYSTGAVFGNIETGGLIGENGGTVTECYSTGWLWGTSDVGGLVGYDYDWSQADRCFWDTQTSGQATSAGGTGKTTAEMQTAKTFLDAGWDFVGETANGTDDIWWILEGQDYPRLWWEESN